MGRFTTILWDLDQTILDFKKSQNYALRYSFGKLGLEINDDIVSLYNDINDSYWKRMERGEIGKEEIHKGRFKTLFEQLGITGITTEEIEEIYQNALGSVFFFQDEADKLIMQLKEKGFKQYIITNGFNKTQANKVHISGLDKMVDGVFVSEIIGCPKPYKEYFDACLARMDGVLADECIIVGDSLTSDIQGGLNAGITTCWYNPTECPNSLGISIDYEIRILRELLNILC
ncbi:MAG: YjjG family noncanonical pyrimidine nucleotidase [Lachnospiraceae bacterium]|nr:YjjG family noncanonical pyrimidine nucleotidase [Lachnospiraceae bacterium]